MLYFEYVKELLLKIINVILPKQKKTVSVTDSLAAIQHISHCPLTYYANVVALTD